MTTPIEWIFVITFSFLVSLTFSIFDEILYNSIEFRYKFCTDSSKSSMLNFFFWILSAVIIILLATSPGHFISKEADGSGIPEVKTVLSGFNIFKYFSFEVFIAKIIGLYFSMVGGKIKNYFYLKSLRRF
jgi:H+/Cl- antiporter ClcA